jgi:predicted chitinase
MPNLPTGEATTYMPFLNSAMIEGKINTVIRVRAFLAQVAHESGEFRYWTELGNDNCPDYEGGCTFKGRGPIQLTHRSNYAAAGKALGLDLINNPGIVATPAVGFRTTVWYWTSNNLNSLADSGNFVGLTRAINGGTNGLDDRYHYLDLATACISSVGA